MVNRYFSINEIMGSALFSEITEPPKKAPKAQYDSEVEKFLEIVDFFIAHGREPQKVTSDLTERSLASRLVGIRKNPERLEYLRVYDEMGLLETTPKEVVIPKITSVDDILKSGSAGLLAPKEINDAAALIFDTSSLPSKVTTMPEYVAKRKKIKDFDEYEKLFKKCSGELREGKRRIVPFKNEQDIQPNSFYVLKGVLLYVESVGKRTKIKGKSNARLRCVFANGTESDMLLRSLAAELYKHGRRVTNNEETLLDSFGEDISTGHIYVLKSKSTDPQIQSLKNLYKIGFTTGSVEQRIKNAENESTYLYAPVEIVATYEVFNMNASKFETAIHHYLSNHNLDVSILGANGKLLVPKEWFFVSLEELQDIIDEIVMRVNL